MICYTEPAPFLLQPLVAFASHHRCNYCGNVCWAWQDCIRPSDAYHAKCLKKWLKENRNFKLQC